jgi:peptidoglycan-associated lipoprotein
LKPQARSTIEALAAWMNEHPGVALTIEGHCDERGTREYNLALGERRANAVRDYLVALGISGNRLGTISYGKERPAVPGSNESAWAQNRRGVFVVR